MNLTQALAKLNGRDSRKIANNTYLERIDADTVGVRLHRTFVVTIREDSVTLNSGGWHTVTTKARMNDYAPCRVSQERGRWYVDYRGERLDYSDGMTLNTI